MVDESMTSNDKLKARLDEGLEVGVVSGWLQVLDLAGDLVIRYFWCK